MRTVHARETTACLEFLPMAACGIVWKGACVTDPYKRAKNSNNRTHAARLWRAGASA